MTYKYNGKESELTRLRAEQGEIPATIGFMMPKEDADKLVSDINNSEWSKQSKSAAGFDEICKKHYHGFSSHQWDCIKDQFPYCEIKFIAKEYAEAYHSQFEGKELPEDISDIINCIIIYDKTAPLEEKGRYFEQIQRELNNLEHPKKLPEEELNTECKSCGHQNSENCNTCKILQNE
jgi:hypothetical protein